ncbi:MAG TPA: hypothetical protein VK176_07795 [Phycisphaerales bacterium]|nr:hypothetical protein [Phycisphaerales bacterium]
MHTTVTPGIAHLGFSMDVPEGFILPPMPAGEIDFDNPTQSAPLALFSSQVALALIAVAARPAYETGSVLQWMKYLCDHFGMEVEAFRTGVTRGACGHRAIMADAHQEQDGQDVRMVVVAFEDGGWLVTAHAMCAAELWPSYGERLRSAVYSISLTTPKGATRELDSLTAEGWTKVTPEMQRAATEKFLRELEAKRGPAEEAAAVLLAQDRFDEAEAAMQRVDGSIYGAVALAKLYESRLRALVGEGAVQKDRGRVERVFDRALSWAQGCYPDPHTGEEAERYEAGRAEDRARLVAILGYEPR